MNVVVLEGRLVADPEIRYSTGENATASMNFTIAVTRDFKSAQGTYDTDFIRCSAFRNNAEFINKYFHKGDPIQIYGNIRTGSYTNKDGAKVYTTDVFVDRVNFVVGGRNNNDNNNSSNNSNNYNSSGNRKRQPSGYNNDFMNIPEEIDEGLPY